MGEWDGTYYSLVMNFLHFPTGFKTPVGTYAITGIFVLPLWLYGMSSGFLDEHVGLHWSVKYTCLLFLIGGRLLGFTTEVRYYAITFRKSAYQQFLLSNNVYTFQRQILAFNPLLHKYSF